MGVLADLEHRACEWASSDEGLLQLIGRLLGAKVLASEHPLTQRLLGAIRAYVNHKRRMRWWVRDHRMPLPWGGTMGTEALRDNVEVLLNDLRADLGLQGAKALTRSMGEHLNGRPKTLGGAQ